MKGRPRSIRQAQAILAGQLREQGRSWAQIGSVFQATYRVNPRVALRQAHGWSQPQAAERWTMAWPDDPKTFKNFSYWEQWPGQTGHPPSLDTLDRLAQLYECKVTDLLTDSRDYGVREIRPEPRAAATSPPAMRTPSVAELATDSSSALQAALELIRQAGTTELTQAAGADDLGTKQQRRRLLLEASSTLAVVAAAPVLEVPRIVAGPRAGRIPTDLAIVTYAIDVVGGLRRLGGAVGPRITLPPAMALRSAMAALGRNVPEIVTGQALTAYGDLTQLIGWLMFNLGDHNAAGYYYNDARAAAYRAGNDDLVSFTLAAASQLAGAGNRPQLAVDHGQAAAQAARSAGCPYAVAYAADVTARAYAAAGQRGRCHAALDRELEALSKITDDAPRSPWWYFYDSSFFWGTESECAIRLNDPVDAGEAARRSLQLPATLNLHNTALTLALRTEALIMQREFDAACEPLADAARLTTLNSSRRIARRIESLRRQLRIAGDTPAVRDLDEKLAEYRRARAASEPPAVVPAEML